MGNVIKYDSKTNHKKENKMKSLIDLSTSKPLDFNNNTLAHLWERVRVRGATHVNRPLAKAKFAFTLAEVLITLGIIGVVAALTIPSLINNYKAKRLHTQFLKSYSTIQQVFKQMEADDVSLDPSTYGGGMFYKTFMNYLTGATDCYRNLKNPLCAPDVNADYYSTKKDLYKTLDGSKTVIHWYFDDGMIALQDGTLLLFENAAREDNIIWVSVDLNGYNNPPNRWGYDLFTFQFIDGELKTMGDKGTTYTDVETYCNPKGSDKLNGVSCAHKAKVNTDYFKDLINEFK